MAGYQAFVDGLRAAGYVVEERGDNRVSFPYTIPIGKFAGRVIELGFVAPGDFPANPPSGPHLRPHLLPITNGGGSHPSGGVHPSGPFGDGWQYWSRPLNHWGSTTKTVKDVLRHIHHLFATQ